MDKKSKAVYAPGELSRVREKLGNINEEEAKRVAQLLGGEVGTERSPEPQARAKPPIARRGDYADTKSKASRGSAAADDSGRNLRKTPKVKQTSSDDPSLPLKLSYFERVKMDKHASQSVFEIKNSFQVLISVLSIFREPQDYINPRFVSKRINEHYSKIEKLVTSTRILLPRNNPRRSNKLKRISPFAFSVLDTLRSWDIETMAREIAALQARPRSVTLDEFSVILRLVYRPLFIMENLDMEEHIKGSFKLLYKILYLESPLEAKEKFQEVIRTIIISLGDVRRDVQFYLYPMVMKLTSDRLFSYENFFIERRRRYMAFLNITEQDQINTEGITSQLIEEIDIEVIKNESGEEEEADGENGKEEDPDDPKVIARNAAIEAEKAERIALEQGLAALENLFPKAGWEKLEEFPDLYPYFSGVYSLRRGFDLIAPADALQQLAVLMHILEDLFFAMRYVKFDTVTDSDGIFVNVESRLGDIINNWQRYIDDGFYKEYLPRLSEYCRVLENSSEARTSPFSRKLLNELNWVKRLYFLPYCKFETRGTPPLKKQEITTIYTEVSTLRKYLSAVAAGIEKGISEGGAKVNAVCGGIGNPWAPYKFEVPNPVSKRLSALLPRSKRNNASLIFFSLSVATVLDYIINNENSWSYNSHHGPPFRSINNDGVIPQFGVDDKVDADKIFVETMKKNAKEAAKEAAK